MSNDGETEDLSPQIRIDRIAEEFETAFRSGKHSSIESLVEQNVSIAWPLFEALLRLELELRGENGEEPQADAYCERFPDYVELVEKVFGRPQDTKEPLATTAPFTSSEDSRDWIGPYKILQPIGKGGMGQVFMAEQYRPVKRRVALKVIKTDTPTKEILARFEAERQALAMMDHQNIAKVLDAGVTSDGRPYFAMELVKGVPITEYCNKNRLTTDERLGIFVQTCRAIQHAHQKGIVHRDLKPSNILVTLYDGEPVAKVIDFGLAKALFDQTQLTDRTLFTQYGQVVGTLEYMSPEQAEFNAMDVDTRTDVFSLGVIFFELLTGSTPIGRERLRKEALDQILRIIREEDAPRPSSRLSESGDAITGIAEQRKTDPRKLTLVLKGELDWIAIKALEKDRTRRYDSPAALADDVQRYLDGDAIEARPPSLAYQVTKAAQNRGLFAAIASIASVLLIALVCTTFLWTRAERLAFEKDEEATRATRAEQVQSRLTEEAQRARDAEKTLRLTSQQATAQVQLEKGLELANQGLISEGLGWMTRALRSAPAGESKIAEVIRRNIAAWLPYTPEFVGSLDLEGDVGFEMAFSEAGDFLALTLQSSEASRRNDVFSASRLVIAQTTGPPKVVLDRDLGVNIQVIRYVERLECFLVALSDGTMAKVDVNGTELGRVQPLQTSITDIFVSTTGNVYVSDNRGGIFGLNESLDSSRLIFNCNESVLKLSVSARESRFLALGSGNTVYVFDKNGKLLNQPFDAGGGYAHALDADRCLVACSDFSGSQSSSVRVWNALQGQFLDSVELTNNTNYVSFDPQSGDLITTDKGLIVTGWDLREFAPVWQYSVPLVPILSKCQNSYCASLSVGIEGTNLRIYQLPVRKRATTVVSGPASHQADLNGNVSLWLNQRDDILDYEDLHSGKICGMVHVPGVASLDGYDQDSFATGFQPNGIALWDAQSLAVVRQTFLPVGFAGMYGMVSFEEQGVPNVAVGGNMKGNFIAKLNLDGAPELRQIGPPFFNYALAWSEADRLLAIGAHDGTIKVYRVSGELVSETNPPLDAEIFSLDLSDDEHEIIASTRLGTVYTFTFPGLQRIAARRGRFGPYPRWYYGDGDRFVAGGMHAIEVRDRQTLLQIGRRNGHDNSSSLARIRDGSLVYSGSVVAGTGEGISVIQRQHIPEPVRWVPEDAERRVEQRLGQRIVGEGGVTQLISSPEEIEPADERSGPVASAVGESGRRLSVMGQFESWKASRAAYGNKDSKLASHGHGATRYVADLQAVDEADGPEVLQQLSDDQSKGEVSTPEAAVAWGLKEGDLLVEVEEKESRGLRIINVSEYTMDGERLFCAVWNRSKFESAMELGADRDTVHRKDALLTSKGYRVVSCEPAAWGSNENSDRYHLVWSSEPGEPTTLSLGTPERLWSAGVEVEESWRRKFNQDGFRVPFLHTRTLGGHTSQSTAIWSKTSSNQNRFRTYLLADTASYAANDGVDFNINQRIGLRRVSAALEPTFPNGLWEGLLSDQSTGSLWTGAETPPSYKSALILFFRGKLEESYQQLNSITEYGSDEERDTVQLFKILTQLRLGERNLASELVSELKSRLGVPTAANKEEQRPFVDGVLPLLEMATEVDSTEESPQEAWESRVSKVIERIPRGRVRVNVLVVASLATAKDSARREFQRRAVAEMERSEVSSGTWFQGVYGTLWETPEFQSFARRAEFDIFVSTVWMERNGRQSAVAEALDFSTLAGECGRAMEAGYVPKTISIAERAGGRGIGAVALLERDNAGDWLSLLGQEASRRRAAHWAAKKAVQAVNDWVVTGDSTDVTMLTQPGRSERGLVIRAAARNQEISKEMYLEHFPKNTAMLMAMARAESPEIRKQAWEIASRILADSENRSASARSAARWVAETSGVDLDESAERSLTAEDVLANSTDLVQVQGHNDQNMVVLNGDAVISMGSRVGEVGRLPNEIQHRRKLETKKFAIGTEEVTVAQFRRFRSEFASESEDDRVPATGISWYDATAYCNWLSRLAGLPKSEWVYLPVTNEEDTPGMSIPKDWWRRGGYRLPTEVEWEFACRASSTSAFPFGHSVELLDDYGWTIRNSGGELQRVGRKMPNAVGLFDMLGNASEWCHSSHELYLAVSGEPSSSSERPGLVDPDHPRSVRGGSGLEFQGNARSAFRDYYPPGTKLPSLGFRVARTIVP